MKEGPEVHAASFGVAAFKDPGMNGLNVHQIEISRDEYDQVRSFIARLRLIDEVQG
jgi:hypothetical protein